LRTQVGKTKARPKKEQGEHSRGPGQEIRRTPRPEDGSRRACTEGGASIGPLATLEQDESHNHGSNQYMHDQDESVKRSHQSAAALQMLTNSVA
jgi:hypothetical protein